MNSFLLNFMGTAGSLANKSTWLDFSGQFHTLNSAKIKNGFKLNSS